MEEYVLYLDESEDSNGKVFVIGGFIIKKTEIKKLEQYIVSVKKCIWDDNYILNKHPILHCADLNMIKNNRSKKYIDNIIKKYEFLDELIGKTSCEIKSIYDNVYIKLCETVKHLDIVPLGCILDLENLKFIYDDYANGKHELFFEIAMQQIIENFSYFLYRKKGVGSIIYESRNGETESRNSNNSKMFDNFCKIKICNKGISFITQQTMCETVKYFNTYSKHDDIAGLQLADFIAYEFMHKGHDINDNNYPEFAKKIFTRLYNGEFSLKDKDLRNYFGLKNFPSDYNMISSLKSQLATLKKAYKNIKRECNKLKKNNKFIKETKQKLVEENDKLRIEISNLTNNNT